MSQITGFPGNGVTIGLGRKRILFGLGNPNNSTTRDVMDAGLGSTFTRTDTGQIWQVTTAGVYGPGGVLLSQSVWTQNS